MVFLCCKNTTNSQKMAKLLIFRGNLYLKPADANTGILFKRTDVDSEKSIIEASYKNVGSPIL